MNVWWSYFSMAYYGILWSFESLRSGWTLFWFAQWNRPIPVWWTPVYQNCFLNYSLQHTIRILIVWLRQSMWAPRSTSIFVDYTRSRSFSMRSSHQEPENFKKGFKTGFSSLHQNKHHNLIRSVGYAMWCICFLQNTRSLPEAVSQVPNLIFQLASHRQYKMVSFNWHFWCANLHSNPGPYTSRLSSRKISKQKKGKALWDSTESRNGR